MSYYTSIIVLVLFALVVLSVLISENDRISRDKKRLFIATNILIAISALSECAGVHIGDNPNIPSQVLSIVKVADYTLTPLTCGALIALIRKPGQNGLFLKWLFIGNAVFQILAAFNGWMTVIDENNHYSHGPLYFVYIILYSVVLLILAVKLVIYGKSFRKQNRLSLYLTMSLIFVGIGIQEIMGNDHRVIYVAITLGYAFLYIHYSEFSQMLMDDRINEQQVIITNDALTGSLSRFAYIDAINEYSSSVPDDLAVFMMDINGLKNANDSFGHEAGDELICGAARCIEASVGKYGKTFRIGGDEFVVLANMTREQAETAMAELEQETGSWSGAKIKNVSVSAGYALAKDFCGYSAEELAKEADKAMYEQKKAYYDQNNVERRKVF